MDYYYYYYYYSYVKQLFSTFRNVYILLMHNIDSDSAIPGLKTGIATTFICKSPANGVPKEQKDFSFLLFSFSSSKT